MILALAGGVGGAKLVNGLARLLPPSQLTIVVNTGDDFEHLGLHIAPDLDSVLYALAGRNDPVRGWGLAGESWAFMDALKDLGGPGWFQLGDRDLATHLLRSRALAEGETLSAVTALLAARMGIAHSVAPMSDEAIRSIVATDEGELVFQEYFVGRQGKPVYQGIRFEGIEAAAPSPSLKAALTHPDLRAILLCPSNPWLSIAPILAVPGVRAMVEARTVPLIAVSPFVGGQAIKGPAAKIMREIGSTPNADGLIRHYGALLDGLVVHPGDRPATPPEGVAILETDILIPDPDAQRRLAAEVVAFAERLSHRV